FLQGEKQVAAVVGSVGGSVPGSGTQKRIGFGSVEPALLAALKQLEPLVAVLTLTLSALCFGVPFTPAIGAVAVLTFVISGRVFGRTHRDEELHAKSHATILWRIILEWSAVVCVLLLTGFAFKVTAQFSRAMMLTWFAVTPLTLYAVHVARLRARWLISNSDLA